jgi:hypothetical protein
MKNFLRKYFRPSQKTEILKEIEAHRELIHKADKALDRMKAALDGETGWFDCGCVKTNKNRNPSNGTCSNIAPV